MARFFFFADCPRLGAATRAGRARTNKNHVKFRATNARRRRPRPVTGSDVLTLHEELRAFAAACRLYPHVPVPRGVRRGQRSTRIPVAAEDFRAGRNLSLRDLIFETKRARRGRQSPPLGAGLLLARHSVAATLREDSSVPYWTPELFDALGAFRALASSARLQPAHLDVERFDLHQGDEPLISEGAWGMAAAICEPRPRPSGARPSFVVFGQFASWGEEPIYPSQKNVFRIAPSRAFRPEARRPAARRDLRGCQRWPLFRVPVLRGFSLNSSSA